jgi:hypothetical protein
MKRKASIKKRELKEDKKSELKMIENFIKQENDKILMQL